MDLFAGCGGMTLGCRATGRIDPVFAVEADADAATTYERNFGSHVQRRSDRSPATIEEIVGFLEVDIVVGGPPCQGFSPLNMRGVGPERRGLWREYLRALRAAAPSVFVMENVPELLTSPEYSAFRRAVADELSDLGYHVDHCVLNAADYGVPQTRRRAIVVGTRLRRPFEWPAPTHSSNPTPGSGLKPWRTFADAVTGLPLEPSNEDWHDARNPSPVSLERYRTIPEQGANRFDLAARRPDITPRCWLSKPSGSTDVFGRLWWDRPAVTIRTEFFKPEKGRYLHPSEHRPITVREAARCMTFPDPPEFVFPDRSEQSMTSVARQIGNAAPPLLAKALAQAVVEHLDGASTRNRGARVEETSGERQEAVL